MLNIKSQKGFGLILLFLTVLAAGAVFLISTLDRQNSRVSSENATSEALAQAKVALISHAVSYYLGQSNSGITHAGTHGLLPCPETNIVGDEGRSSGSCAKTDANSLGRLPWWTLDLPPLKDASGECLWYALSGGFFNYPQSDMTNADTPGMFQLFDEQKNLIYGATPEDRVVAVVIAPEAPLANQNRLAADSVLPCGVARDLVVASDYLDSYQGIDNAIVDTINKDQIEDFITSNGINKNSALNDRIITITSNEIFNAIRRNAAMYDNKFRDLGLSLGNCLIDYADAASTPASACLTTCYADCEDALNLCLLAASGGKEISTCQTTKAQCRKDCRKSCKSTGGGKGKGKGSGGASGSAMADLPLPWPAAIDLSPNDYRDDASYVDINGATQGHFGRLPNLTPNSSAKLGTTDPAIFTTCNLSITNLEMFTLWQNWKDHWFYVVGRDFSPTATGAAPTPCSNCPTVGGVKQSAVLIFSGQRTTNQLRRSNETEISTTPPAIADTKATLSNYLEGSNSGNYQDATGSGDYDSGVNDRLFCINQAVDAVTECTP